MSKKKKDKNFGIENDSVIDENVGTKDSSLSFDEKNIDLNNKNNVIEDLQRVDIKVVDSDLKKIDDESKKLTFDEEVIEGRLEEVREKETPKKKKKSRIVNTIFLIVNVVLMIFIVSSFMDSYGEGFNLKDIIANQGDRLWWILLGVGFYIVFILTESGMFSVMIKGSTGRYRPYLSYRVATIGKYYDNITPFSVGGQPFQIVALAKDGMNAGISTSLPIIKVIVYNLVYTIIILLAFIIGMPLTFTGDMVSNFVMLILNFIAIIGLVFTALSSILFILIGNGKIIGRGLARWVVKIGYKLRLVKNYRQTYNKLMMQVREYQRSMEFLRNNKGVMIKSVILSIIQILAYFSMPFAIMLAFTTNTDITIMTWFICFTKFLICQMAAVILPLPGGTGMMELSFMIVFSTPDMFGSSVVIGLLIWRIISYYLLIVHGFIQTVIDNTSEMIKSKRSTTSELNRQ